jgi:CHRD domain-containing protein
MRKACLVVLSLSIVLLAASVPAQAQGGTAITRLRSFEEVPAASTPGGGFFTGTINEDGTEIEYELNYFNIEGNVTQAHLHFGQRSVNGGIVVFLCSNLGNGPAGTQACPTKSGTITGTITAANVLAASNPPGGQSFFAGEFAALLRGIRAGVVYANVHTDQLPGGSIRGQLLFEAEP